MTDDPFWNRESDKEEAKSLSTWPGAFAATARTFITAIAFVAIIYILVRYG